MPGPGENPYSALLRMVQSLARDQAPPAWETATVVSRAPLRLMYRGVQIDADQVTGSESLSEVDVGDEIPLLPGADGQRFAPLAPADLYKIPAHVHPWEDVSDKPTVYPPAAHVHPWEDVSDKPTVYPPAAHGHPASDITGLSAYVFDLLFPVGHIVERDVNESPALVRGVWEAYGPGRVLVGRNPSDTDFSTAGAEGGEKQHALTADEGPSHRHEVGARSGATAFGGYGAVAMPSNSGTASSVNTGYAGSGTPHNNMPPYVVVYRWRRTA